MKDTNKKFEELLNGFEEFLETKRTLTREEVIEDYLNYLKKEKSKIPETMQKTYDNIIFFIENTKKYYFIKRNEDLKNGK